MATKKQVAVKEQNAPAVQNEVPDWLKDKMGQTSGSENVNSDDLIIPRLELVQALSKCRQKRDAQYIEGAEEGMLYNNLTRELHGEEVLVVPVFFKKEYLVWRDQELGGGFAGSHETQALAEDERAQQENPDEWESVETHLHFCMLIREDGGTEEVVLSMAKSKIRKSKAWNSLIRINGGPRYSRVYKVAGVEAKNDKNQDYFNIDITNHGFVSEEVFHQAEETYKAISEGQRAADHTYDAASGGIAANMGDMEL